MMEKLFDNRTTELFERYVDDRLDEAGAEELLAIFQDDPALGVLFYEQFCADFFLSRYYGKGMGVNPFQETAFQATLMVEWLDPDELARLAASSPALPRKADETPAAPRHAAKITTFDATKSSGTSRTLAILLPLILALFGAAVYFEWRPPKEEDGFVAVAQAPSTPAVLIDRDDVVWTGDARPPELGVPLPPGVLAFESGTIELLFFNGVRGIVEGPAELLLLDEKRVFCKRGRWSVTVPPQGKGFEIQATNLIVRDLGTRFYAAIDRDRCDVHVVEGTVETERNDGQKTLFQAGAGAVYQGGEVIERLAGLASDFLTRAEMRRRSDATFFHAGKPDAPRRDEKKSAAIRTIDFAQTSPGDAILVGGNRLVEGPTPDSRAFRFAGSKDCVSVRPMGDLAAMTAVLRLKLNRLDRDLIPILMTEGSKKHGLVLQVRSSGKVALGVRFQSSRHAGVFETPVVFTEDRLGRWISLALTVDASRRSIGLFIEGEPVFSATLPLAARAKFDPLNVGCWKMHAGEDAEIRQLDGDLGGLLIFDRVLNLNEIRLLSEDVPDSIFILKI